VEKFVVMTTNFPTLALQSPPQQLSPVEAHLAYWLHYVGSRVFHALRCRTLECGVTAAESVLLRKLYEYETGAMPIRLASQLGLSRGYISRLAVRLEAKGLIHREKSLSDRRTLTLTVSKQGRTLLPTLARQADKNNALYFAGAGEAAHQTIEQVMKWIVYRGRFRLVPPVRCRIRKYRYLHLIDMDWEGNEESDGDGDGDGYG
jgi:DNA-binding MarR family transcriptional regulator